ncbi:DNA N-6-adenine-methyltransferase [Candidatus Lokiarchaeum ossiferum]|uniref:DNA N-6-adenine-methyltransferase n=1 Tax=Candidatus Lokiarchaeum ossiferum TaxID=2951803 RepID=UPI00352CA8E8
MSNSVNTDKSHAMKVCHSTGKNDWGTPQDLYDKLNAEFNFTLDACASAENTKCEKFYSKEQNALIQDWSKDIVFMNPPYSTKLQNNFVEKAYEESLKGATVVCLLPSRTSTIRFHKYCMKGEIRFLEGRLQFEGAPDPAPFPSMIVIFRSAIPEYLPMFNPFTHEKIKPTPNKTALVRMGGKRYAAKIICKKIAKIDHSLYCEPFFGGGRIFYQKNPEFMAIINDVERKIVNFNFVVKNFPEEFHQYQSQLVKDENTFFDLYDFYHDSIRVEELHSQLQTTKKLWEKYQDEESKIFMVNAAADFYFYCNMAFRGSLTAKTMTYPENDPRTEKNRLRWRIFREIRWMKDRMRNTTILCQDFEKVIIKVLRYSNHIILFYLDPPYYETEGYESEFTWKDYLRLKATLDLIQYPHYFILSLNDHPAIIELFADYDIQKIPTHYTTGGAGQKKDVFELLITPKWKPKSKSQSIISNWVKISEGGSNSA